MHNFVETKSVNRVLVYYKSLNNYTQEQIMRVMKANEKFKNLQSFSMVNSTGFKLASLVAILDISKSEIVQFQEVYKVNLLEKIANGTIFVAMLRFQELLHNTDGMHFSTDLINSFLKDSKVACRQFNAMYLPGKRMRMYSPTKINPEILLIVARFCGTYLRGECICGKVEVVKCSSCTLQMCFHCLSNYYNYRFDNDVMKCPCNNFLEINGKKFPAGYYVCLPQDPVGYHYAKVCGTNVAKALELFEVILKTRKNILDAERNYMDHFDFCSRVFLERELLHFNNGIGYHKVKFPNLFRSLLNFTLDKKNAAGSLHFFNNKPGFYKKDVVLEPYRNALMRLLQTLFRYENRGRTITVKEAFTAFMSFDGGPQFANIKSEIRNASFTNGYPEAKQSERLFKTTNLMCYMFSKILDQRFIDTKDVSSDIMIRASTAHGTATSFFENMYLKFLPDSCKNFFYNTCDLDTYKKNIGPFYRACEEHTVTIVTDFKKFDLSQSSSLIIKIFTDRFKIFYDIPPLDGDSLPYSPENAHTVLWLSILMLLTYHLSYQVMASPDGKGYLQYPGTLASGVFYTTYFNSLLNLISAITVYTTVLGISVEEFFEHFTFRAVGDDFIMVARRSFFFSKVRDIKKFKEDVVTRFSQLNLTIPIEEFNLFDSPFRTSTKVGPDFLRNELFTTYCPNCSKIHIAYYRSPENIFGKLFHSASRIMTPSLLAIKCITLAWGVGVHEQVYNRVKLIYELCLCNEGFVLDEDDYDDAWVRDKMTAFDITPEMLTSFPSFSAVRSFNLCRSKIMPNKSAAIFRDLDD